MSTKEYGIINTNLDTAQKKLPSVSEKENFKNFLNKVDFTLLKKVFITKLHTIGINNHNINSKFVTKENISQISLIENIAFLYALKGDFKNSSGNFPGQIRLNKAHVKISKWLKNQDNKTKDSEEFYSSMLSILCHEESHAISHHSHTKWKQKNYLLDVSSEQAGFGIRNIEKHRL